MYRLLFNKQGKSELMTYWETSAMNLKRYTLLFLFALSSLHAATHEEISPNLGPVRVVPVEPTPEPGHVQISINYPKAGEVRGSSVSLQANVGGFPLGVMSQFPRRYEIYNDRKGQTLRIILDDNAYYSIDESFLDSLDNHETYYDQAITFAIPEYLEPGMHVLRIFPVRSFQESLKCDNCFVARVFYSGWQDDNLDVDISQPFLTYNQPLGVYRVRPREPILLDFFISNCQLSKDGYKVRLTIDDGDQRILTQWVPYYIYGLRRGTHTIRLELLNPQNRKVPGRFNDVTHKIEIR